MLCSHPLHPFPPVTIVQVLSSRYCNYWFKSQPLLTYRAIPRFVLGVALLVFAVIPTLQQLFETFKITGRFQTNRPTNLLVREGIVYFVVCVSIILLFAVLPFIKSHSKLTGWTLVRNLLFNVVYLIQLPDVNLTIILGAVIYSLPYIIAPRFIINIRELYDRDLRDRWQGIDAGFGVFSHPGSSEDMAMSAVASGDEVVGENEAPGRDTSDTEEFPLEVVEECVSRV